MLWKIKKVAEIHLLGHLSMRKRRKISFLNQTPVCPVMGWSFQIKVLTSELPTESPWGFLRYGPMMSSWHQSGHRVPAGSLFSLLADVGWVVYRAGDTLCCWGTCGSLAAVGWDKS